MRIDLGVGLEPPNAYDDDEDGSYHQLVQDERKAAEEGVVRELAEVCGELRRVDFSNWITVRIAREAGVEQVQLTWE